MTGNGTGADPLGIARLLEISTKAIESARTPADALTKLADAIDAERSIRADENEQLNRLLREWVRNLRLIAPMLPDVHPTQTPTLGPYPRHQDLLRALGENTERYQSALMHYLDALTDLAEDCTDALRTELETRYPDRLETLIDEIAELDHDLLVNLWQTIAEPRYESWLAKRETQKRIAELVNAWSALTQALRTLADEYLEGLGLPSRGGMEDLAAELQRQRRRHRQELDGLRAEINALKTALQPNETGE